MFTKKIHYYNDCIEYLEKICKSNESLINFKDKIEEMLYSKDSQVRGSLAKYLINFSEEYSKKILCQLVSDKDWMVRSDAIISLEDIGNGNNVIEKLYDAIKEERNYLNISLIINTQTIIHIQNKIDTKILIEWLFSLKYKYATNVYILPSILAALVLIGKTDFYDELISLYSNENEKLKLSIVTSLYNIIDFNIFSKTKGINDRILIDVNFFSRYNKKKFPYINHKLDDIIKKMKDDYI